MKNIQSVYIDNTRKDSSKIKLSLLNISLFAFGLASLLYNVETVQQVGFVLLLLFVGIQFILLVHEKEVRIDSSILYVSITLLGCLLLWEMTRVITFRSVEIIVCFAISIIVLHVFSSVKVMRISFNNIQRFFFLEVAILYAPIFSNFAYNPMDNGYWSIYSTTTFLGIFGCLQIQLCLIFYYITKNKKWITLICLFAGLVYLSHVRTAYIGLFIAVMTYLFRRYTLHMSSRTYRFIKWLFIAGIITFVLIYPMLQTFSWYDQLEVIVLQYTGKILLSGRNEIWSEAFLYIAQNPILGYGLDTTSIDISMHNSYLQHIMESGIIGIVLLFFLLNSILNNILKNKSNLHHMLLIFTLVNLLMCTTEVMLLHGQMILQIIMWAIMGLGLNQKLIVRS